MPPRDLLPNQVKAQVRVRSRGYLLHWEVENGIYSITIRLADSIPAQVYNAIRADEAAYVRAITGGIRKPTAIENAQIRKFLFFRVDRELDLGCGHCWMNRPEIADLVATALNFFDGERYDLFAWTVMPNHAHAVLQTYPGWGLERLLHSWKSYISNRANEMLGRVGEPFWFREYFDRLIRGPRDLAGSIAYVLNNPSKARLDPWPWVGRGKAIVDLR